MKSIVKLLVLSGAGLIIACATTPKELTNARYAYTRAKEGPTAKTAPAELHKAKVALDKAEEAFADEPRSARAIDLAYVAQRSVQLAEIKGSIASEHDKVTRAKKEVQSVQSEIIKQTKEELNKAVRPPREVIVTLSGSVLFASNKATLLPSAKTKLNEVADALLKTKERTLIIEGHTDSQGTDSLNRELSYRRANAVRVYLISRGYSTSKLEAVGAGPDHPVASNTSAEGRANNRRVEISVNR